ncbi:MAG: VanZ family protein [Terracidiphilus sp.]
MASSSMIFEMYAPQTMATEPSSWREWRRAWLPVLAFSLIFAVESTSYLGSEYTSAPLRRVAEALIGYDACVNWEVLHRLIRKTGHFVGYGFFALVCFRGFWISLCGVASRVGRQVRANGLAILLTFLVAGADELHQSFVPNRFGSFSDVLLDTCGGVMLCFVLFLAMQTVEWIKHAPSLRDFGNIVMCHPRVETRG